MVKRWRKNTKYFLGRLEKRHHNRKNIRKLKVSNKEITSDKEILQEAKACYKNLFTSTAKQSSRKNEDFFNKIDDKLEKLNDLEKNFCKD